MSTTYNPSANNTASYTLPSDGDPGNAESVNGTLRGLADKAHFLDTAKLPSVEWTDAEIAVFGTPTKPNQHPSSGSNKWKQILAAPTNIGSPNAYIRIFSGAGDSNGTWAITFNAAWDADSGGQAWTADNTGHASVMLLGLPDGQQLLRRDAGSGTWTSWPGFANLGISGDLSAGGDLSVTDDAQINGDLGVGGGLNVTGTSALASATLSGTLTYASPPSRTKSVNLFRGFGSGSVLNDGEQISIPVGGRQIVPIEVPHGAVLGAMKFRVGGVGGIAQYTISLCRRHAINFGASTGTPGYTYSTVDTDTGTAASPGPETESDLSWGGLTANAAEEYQVVIACDGASPNALYVVAANIVWTDPGLSY